MPRARRRAGESHRRLRICRAADCVPRPARRDRTRVRRRRIPRAHHRGETRMHSRIEYAPAECGDAAFAIERAERVEQIACLRQRTGRRRIEPAQCARSPRREFKRQLRKFHLCDFGRAIGVEPPALRPEAIPVAGTESTGAASALIGRCLRDRDRFQARETGIRIETRFARESRYQRPRARRAASGSTRRRSWQALRVAFLASQARERHVARRARVRRAAR